MKQITFLIAAITWSLLLASQSIPNNGFEDWTLTSYFDPLHWRSSNIESIQSNSLVTVFPVDGYNGSGYAIRMVTGGHEGLVMPGYFSNTGGDPLQGQGGEEYHEIPSMLSGYARYQTMGVDTALLVVVFKKDGAVISSHTIPFFGDQDTFVQFHEVISVPELPDSVIIAAVSSDVRNPQVMSIGSFLELDELTFEGRYIMPQLPNHDFEHWMHGHIHHANDWTTLGLMVERTEDAPFGDFAAMMTSYEDWDNHVHPSGMITGYLNESQEWVGGIPYTEIVDTLRGWYKYTSYGNDAGCLSLQMLSNQVNVGGAFYQFYPTENWTQFEIPIQLYQTPDTLRMQLMSSAFPFDEATPGSSLFIDNLELSAMPLLIEEFTSPLSVSAYPNPATNAINLNLSRKIEGDVMISIYSEKGDLIKCSNQHQSGELLRFSLEGFESGTYFYEVTGNRVFETGKFIVR
jgi:hypothetical protein